jgi:uncharacterized protein HemX
MNDDLWERIDQLERENRWWKRVATAALGALAVLLFLGAGLGVYQFQQARVARLRAEQAADEVQVHRALHPVQKVEEKKP